MVNFILKKLLKGHAGYFFKSGEHLIAKEDSFVVKYLWKKSMSIV